VGGNAHRGRARPAGHGWVDDVLEATLDAVFSYDSGGRIVEMNDSAQALFGYSKDEAIGQLVADLAVPPEGQARHWQRLLGMATGTASPGESARVQTVAVRRDGERFPIELTVVRTGEDPPCFTAFIRDRSEFERADRAERRLTRQLAAADEIASVGRWELDLRSNELTWSDHLYRLAGLEPRSAPPGADMSPVHSADLQGVRQEMDALLRRPASAPAVDASYTYRVVGPDGSVRHLLERATLERDEAGHRARLVGTARDVTERRLHERELMAAQAATRSLAGWTRFDDHVGDLLRDVGTAMDCRLGSAWTRDTDRRAALRCCSVWCAPSFDAGSSRDAVHSLCPRPEHAMIGEAWRTRAPVVVEDLSDDPSATVGGAAARLRLRGAMALPVVCRKETIAVLCLHTDERTAVRQSLVETLSRIGMEIGTFMCRRLGELRPRSLSRREVEVLGLAADGFSGPRIAERLTVSPATVKSHFQRIYQKLGVADRGGAVAHGLRLGLIE
jgi:PAS domain S-box-containing protein